MTEVKRLLVVILIFASLIEVATARGGLVPSIPKGEGERCVEDTGFMRRNHMELLKHQRNETLYKGIRTSRYSLQECISCHTVLGTNGKPVTISSPEHFCNVCHAYVAVTPDCFMCHMSTPGSLLDHSQPDDSEKGRQ